MEINELFKDSLKYPIGDWTKILILGILSLLIGMIFILGFTLALTIQVTLIIPIAMIIAIMVWFIINGYYLSIIRNSINLKTELPSFDIKENLGDGAYLFVIELILGIIPLIIFLLVGSLTGTFDLISNTILARYNSIISSGAVDYNIISQMFTSGFVVTVIVFFILIIIYSLIANIGICRYGKTRKFKEGINISKIFKDISNISWTKYIVWFIILMIITIIIGIISSFITMIPFIGEFIVSLIISPYIMIVSARALGLLYSDV